jgi:hypothetical protein
MRTLCVLACLVSLVFPASPLARGRPSGSAYRDLEARMRLDYAAQHPCPATGRIRGACPGYVVYYLAPSKRVRGKEPWQFAWMTEGEAAASRKEWIDERGVAP